jgi:hypothetical protein
VIEERCFRRRLSARRGFRSSSRLESETLLDLPVLAFSVANHFPDQPATASRRGDKHWGLIGSCLEWLNLKASSCVGEAMWSVTSGRKRVEQPVNLQKPHFISHCSRDLKLHFVIRMLIAVLA